MLNENSLNYVSILRGSLYSQISNTNLERLLLREENIVVLEDLLNTEAQRLERLQKCKENDKLNLGERVSPDELTELFPRICTEVDDFLGIQECDMPTCGYFNLLKDGKSILALYTLSSLEVAGAVTSLVINQNLAPIHSIYVGMGVMQFVMATFLYSMNKSASYTLSSNTITLERTPRTVLIPTAAHEYTHHLQGREGIKEWKYIIFMEGHARGVQKHVSEDYMRREDNEAFLYNVLDYTVGEFKSVYSWMCKKFGQQQKNSLLKTKTSRDLDESLCRLIFKKPTFHAIGNALFSIYQAQQGNHIYRDMIHGRFQFK